MPLFTSVYEDTSPFFVYNGDWNPGNSADGKLSEYSEASFTGTEQNAASMSFQYYGTRVSIIGSRRGNHGRFQVTIDGQIYPEGNGQANTEVFKDTLFVESLNQGSHSVLLENRQAAWLDVDQISWSTNIGTDNEELIVNTVQDSHPSWVYQPTGAWSTAFPEAGTFSGRGGHGTAQQQATAELTFTGDCIALFGGVGPTSAAAYSVQVDSLAAQRFSANQVYARSRQLLYWAGGLGTGNHTIRVRMDSPVANQMLTLDYAEIYTTPSLGGSWEGGPSVAGSSTGTPASSKSSSTGLIAGIAVVAALAGLALLALLFLFLRTRKRRQSDPSTATITSISQTQPQQSYAGSIQPFVTGGAASMNYSNSQVPYMGSATSGNTVSSSTSPTTGHTHGQVQYPMGMMAAVGGHHQSRSDGEAASSSGTGVSSGHVSSGQVPVAPHSSSKAAEAARHRSRNSEAPPAYNPED